MDIETLAENHTKEELVQRVIDTTNYNLELISLLKVLTSDESSPSLRAEARSHARELIRSLAEHMSE